MDVVVMYEDQVNNKPSSFYRIQYFIRPSFFITIFIVFQDGRVLSDPFIKLPTRRELPDYYDVIKCPVDINKILNKIDDGKVRFVYYSS